MVRYLARLTGALVLVMGVILVLLLNNFVKNRLLGQQRERMSHAVQDQSTRLEAYLVERLNLLSSLAAFVRYEVIINEGEFQKFMGDLAADYRNTSLRLVPEQAEPLVFPRDHEDHFQGLTWAHAPSTLETIAEARASRQLLILPPHKINQQIMLPCLLPIFGTRAGPGYEESFFWGYGIVLIGMDAFFAEMQMREKEGVRFGLRNQYRHQIYGESDVFEASPMLSPVNLPSNPWILAGVPEDGWQATVWQPLIMGLGFPLVFLMGWLVVLFQRKTRKLDERNRKQEELTRTMEGIAERNRLLEANDRAQKALREKEESHNRLFRQVPLGLALFKLNGNLIYANTAYAKVIGRTVSETMTLAYYEITPRDYAIREEHILEVLWEKGRYGPYEKEMLHKAGFRVPVRVNSILVEQSGETLIWSTVEDISEQHMQERMLRETQQISADIMDASPSGILIFQYSEGSLKLLEGNSAAHELTGISISSGIGQNLDIIWPVARERAWVDTWKNVAKTGETLKAEYLDYKDDRLALALRVHVFCMPGSRLGMILEDIREHILADEALRQSEERYRILVESAPEAIVVLDPIKGCFIDLNSNAEKLFKITRENLLQRSPIDVSPRYQPDGTLSEVGVMKYVNRALEGTPQVFEWMHLTGDLEPIPCEARLVRIPGGENGLIRGSLTNITARKAAEEELHRLRNLLSNIINSMPSMLVGVTENGRINLWNREAAQSTGVNERYALGRPLARVLDLFADHMPKVSEAIQKQTTIQETRVRWRTEDGIAFKDITIYPLLSEGISGAVIRVDDVSEQVRMQEMMIQTEKMMSVGGLAAGMAHEINNPLAGILQNMQVVRNRFSPELRRNHQTATECEIHMDGLGKYLRERGIDTMIDSIMESGKRAADIVENMLSFSRKGNYQFQAENLAQLMEKTLELASNDYDLKKKFDFKVIEIVRDYEKDMPLVPCEASKMQQVFFNLLQNGAQAMASGQMGDTPRFVLRIRQDGDFARIEIADNGPGMDEPLRKRIFEPFFTTKEVGRGTGLGLSVSYFIVTENHGGKMRVVSALGKGAQFIIHLPLKRDDQFKRSEV